MINRDTFYCVLFSDRSAGVMKKRLRRLLIALSGKMMFFFFVPHPCMSALTHLAQGREAEQNESQEINKKSSDTPATSGGVITL